MKEKSRSRVFPDIFKVRKCIELAYIAITDKQ